MTIPEHIIPKHGGYRHLKSFQLAQLAYDITERFTKKYIDKRSRTVDQMVQAARSGVQNIAEGSQASGTSKKTELFLTNVARASIEELKLDYEDYLRQHDLPAWTRDDPRRTDLIRQRLQTVEQVAQWVHQVHDASKTPVTHQEIAANAALAIIVVACSLLDRQIASLATKFENEGGFSERLYRVRKQKRGY